MLAIAKRGVELGDNRSWRSTSPGANGTPPRCSPTPFFPASGPATGSFNGLHPKSKFLTPLAVGLRPDKMFGDLPEHHCPIRWKRVQSVFLHQIARGEGIKGP